MDKRTKNQVKSLDIREVFRCDYKDLVKKYLRLKLGLNDGVAVYISSEAIKKAVLDVFTLASDGEIRQNNRELLPERIHIGDYISFSTHKEIITVTIISNSKEITKQLGYKPISFNKKLEIELINDLSIIDLDYYNHKATRWNYYVPKLFTAELDIKNIANMKRFREVIKYTSGVIETPMFNNKKRAKSHLIMTHMIHSLNLKVYRSKYNHGLVRT